MSLGALGAVIAGTGTRRRRVLWTLLTAITVSMLLVACGGYGGQKSGPPPRTVTITLSATGGAGGSISHSATLNVTVQ
jgi:hypothetical protein